MDEFQNDFKRGFRNADEVLLVPTCIRLLAKFGSTYFARVWSQSMKLLDGLCYIFR